MDIQTALGVARVPGMCSPKAVDAALEALADEIERLRAQANCGGGHDPERICCAHAADVERLRAIEHRARFTFTEPLAHPAALAAARRILGEDA